MKAKKPVSKNMYKIIVYGGLNKHNDDMLTEEISVPTIRCVCLILSEAVV